MTEKDYSLLRPFDLEAARDGAAIVALVDGGTKMEPRGFVKGPDCMGYCVVVTDEGVYRLGKAHEYRMAPLCWVEGKPVYPGDVLWQTTPAGDVLKRKAKGSYLEFEETGSWAMDGSVSKLSWAEPPPKPVKRWINVYPGMYRDGGPCSTTMHSTKEAADDDLMHGSIACIEIELPPIKP